jgi:hypothetical protein
LLRNFVTAPRPEQIPPHVRRRLIWVPLPLRCAPRWRLSSVRRVKLRTAENRH